MENAMTFDNGLTAEQDDELDNITIELSRLTQRRLAALRPAETGEPI